MSRIKFTIDRLILKGMERVQGEALVDGMRRELSRLLADPANRSEWAQKQRLPVLRLGQMRIETGASGGQKFGTNVAQNITKRLKA